LYAFGLCKQCYRKQKYHENPGKAIQASSDWYARNRERAKEVRRAYWTKNPGKNLARFRRWKYGATEEQVAVMLTAQGGKCAICQAGPAEHLDHDHSTGEVRALLCRGCNAGLGNFADSPARLHLAAEYLEKYARCSAQNIA
jgi:hypothetical protein